VGGVFGAAGVDVHTEEVHAAGDLERRGIRGLELLGPLKISPGC